MTVRPRHVLAVLLVPLLGGCGGDRVANAQPSDPTAAMPSIAGTSAALIPTAVSEEPIGDLTLRQALALALLRSPDLKVAGWEARAWEARQLQARALPNPTLDVDVENFAGSTAYRGTDAAEYTVRLGQVIELGGKRSARINQARLSDTAAQWDYESRRLLVLGAVAEGFVAVVGAQQRVALAEHSLSIAQQAVQIANERVTTGKSAPVEAARAQLALTDARLTVARSQRQLITARTQLAASWGSSVPHFTQAAAVVDDLVAPPPFDLLAARLPQHPDLLRSQAEADSQASLVELERATAVPDVTVGAGYRRFSADDNHAFVASASIPLPVFDRNRGAIAEAQHRLAKARAQRHAAEVTLTSELTATYQRFSSAYEACEQLKRESVPVAEKIYLDVEAGYRAGKFSYLDLLEAQRTVAAIRLQFIDATVDYHQAVAILERLSGGPLPAITASPDASPSAPPMTPSNLSTPAPTDTKQESQP